MAAPANDNFANAQVITGSTGTVAGSNVDATFEVGEPDAGGSEVSIWYRWVAPGSGAVTFDTFGSSFDTILDVFSGSILGSLTSIAYDDDAGEPPPNNSASRVTFVVVDGTTYYIRVNGYSSSDVGDVVLNWAGLSAAQVVVVDQDGTPYGVVANGRVTRVSWELNGPGTAEISLATTDPDAGLLIPGREVQIFHDGNLIWWGPIVRPQAGLHETTWQCAGLLWYFAHRFMGRADRTNLLTNGDFEDDETGWSFSGVTHSIDTGTVNDGAKSLKLEGGTADHDDNAYQIFTHPVGGHPLGDYVTASVWVYIPAADYLGGALNDFGLVAVHRDTDGNVIDADVAEIGDDTTRNARIPLEVGVLYVKEDHTVEVRLFPPHGTAFFDTVTLTYLESLSFPSSEVDSGEVTDIIGGLVDYAQDRLAFDHGKSDLNIDHGGADTGKVFTLLAYQFAEHRNILDAILEYVRNGYCDISIEFDLTTRTFMVWPTATAVDSRGLGKGSDYGTTLELDVNIADFSFSSDLENAASDVIMLGPGDGPDRPEGGATDPSFAGGAFTAEIVEQAPDNTTVGQLDARAADRLKVAARPEILAVTTLPGAGVIGNLAVGDTAHIIISWGWVYIDDTYRVAHIEADPLKDQATITLNPIAT